MLYLTRFDIIHHCPLFFQGSQLIVNYDEHELNNTYKFGVVYQKFGQVSKCSCIWAACKHCEYRLVWYLSLPRTLSQSHAYQSAWILITKEIYQ